MKEISTKKSDLVCTFVCTRKQNFCFIELFLSPAIKFINIPHVIIAMEVLKINKRLCLKVNSLKKRRTNEQQVQPKSEIFSTSGKCLSCRKFLCWKKMLFLHRKSWKACVKSRQKVTVPVQQLTVITIVLLLISPWRFLCGVVEKELHADSNVSFHWRVNLSSLYLVRPFFYVLNSLLLIPFSSTPQPWSGERKTTSYQYWYLPLFCQKTKW